MCSTENKFKEFVKDLTQKIENASVLLTSQHHIADEMSMSYARYQINSLNEESVLKLLGNANKSTSKIKSELLTLTKNTNDNEDESGISNMEIIKKHEIFNILGGNPLAVLLVSSLISGK